MTTNDTKHNQNMSDSCNNLKCFRLMELIVYTVQRTTNKNNFTLAHLFFAPQSHSFSFFSLFILCHAHALLAYSCALCPKQLVERCIKVCCSSFRRMFQQPHICMHVTCFLLLTITRAHIQAHSKYTSS